MEKVKCIIDTSAIISLAASGVIEKANEIFNFIAPLKVKEELGEIADTNDEIGTIALNLLKSNHIEFINLEENEKHKRGEIECVNLANKERAIFVAMDDIKARRKLEKKCNCPIRFSPFIVFILFNKGLLSKEDSLRAIENMKIKRKWKENLVIEYAKLLFQDEK